MAAPCPENVVCPRFLSISAPLSRGVPHIKGSDPFSSVHIKGSDPFSSVHIKGSDPFSSPGGFLTLRDPTPFPPDAPKSNETAEAVSLVVRLGRGQVKWRPLVRKTWSVPVFCRSPPPCPGGFLTLRDLTPFPRPLFLPPFPPIVRRYRMGPTDPPEARSWRGCQQRNNNLAPKLPPRRLSLLGNQEGRKLREPNRGKTGRIELPRRWAARLKISPGCSKAFPVGPGARPRSDPPN
jgi:hypothetical protein